MSINNYFESCQELFAGRNGTPFDANTNQRDYLRIFRVMVREPGKRFGPIAVTSCPGLPLAYSPYQTEDGSEFDLLALLVKATAEQEHKDDWQSWLVKCEYSTRMPDRGTPSGNPDLERPTASRADMNNPELEPPEFEWDFQERQYAPARDLDGKAFVNSAKQPFSPPPAFEQAYPVLCMTRNELTFDINVAKFFAYAVNQDIFLSAPPGSAQCLPPRAKRVFRGNLAFWRVTYKIRFGPPKFVVPLNQLFNPNPGAVGRLANRFLARLQNDLETWQPKFLDCGTMVINRGQPADPLLHNKPIPLIKMGVAVTNPVLLDGNGNELQPNADGTFTPVFLEFRVYPSRPFNRLLQRGFVR